MKAMILGFITLLVFGTFSLLAETKMKRIELNGGSCYEFKTHIENAALTVDGVSMAHWNSQKNELQIIFDDTKTKLKTIEKAIAKAGIDTPDFKATDEDFNKLPDCCKYKRE